MKRANIYNLSTKPQTVRVGERSITVDVGQNAWFPKPKKNIFVETEHGQVFFPTSANFIFLADTVSGTNLTMRTGDITNKSNITIYVTRARSKETEVSYAILPHANLQTLFATGDTWSVEDPLSGKILGKGKLTDETRTLTYDGEGVYMK